MEGRSGIPEQYWELMDQYRDELVGQALAIIGNREDAEDIVQQTFCDAFRDQEKIPQSGSMCAWLRSINRCNALTRVRDRRSESKRMTAQKQQAPEDTFTTGGFSLVELRESMAGAVETLPPILRVVVELRYWKNMSIKEISDQLNIPQGTVQRRLFDATRVLHRTLKKHFDSTQPRPPGSQAADGMDEENNSGELQ